MSKRPWFKVSTWKPKLVGDFLTIHGFIMGDKLDGDDCLWIGKKPDGGDAQVAYPVMRQELTSGTMRDSVMRQSGYSKEHWDLWRSLHKGKQKDRKCCNGSI